MLIGSALYEWMSHNLFVAAAIVGVVAVMLYFAYKKKGRYRQ